MAIGFVSVSNNNFVGVDVCRAKLTSSVPWQTQHIRGSSDTDIVCRTLLVSAVPVVGSS